MATVIDGDGHIFEDNDSILRRMPSTYKLGGTNPTGSPFPPLEPFHFQVGTTPGMRSGRSHIPYPEWAIHVSRAYNDWLYEAYLARDPRFKGVALIPMQEPEAAVSSAPTRRSIPSATPTASSWPWGA